MIHSLSRQWLGKRLGHLLYRPSTLRRSYAAVAAPPTELPRLIITPGSSHHNSLPSFLEYASRVNLSPTRTVYVGTHYEYTVALSLLRLGFSLIRTGRRSDAGIDLIGHWCLPPLPQSLPVIVQCKAGSLKLEHVRELEGAYQGIPPDWRRRDVIGLLVTTAKATKGVMERLGMSPWPMGFMKVTKTGIIEQFIWNRSAAEKGLEGVGVTVRHSPGIMPPDQVSAKKVQKTRGRPTTKRKAAKPTAPAVLKDIQLTWMGQPIFPVRDDLDDMTKGLVREITDEKTVENPKRKRATTQRAEPPSKKKLGRPRGSSKKESKGGETELAPRKVGRPKGSKNNEAAQAKKTGTATQAKKAASTKASKSASSKAKSTEQKSAEKG